MLELAASLNHSDTRRWDQKWRLVNILVKVHAIPVKKSNLWLSLKLCKRLIICKCSEVVYKNCT